MLGLSRLFSALIILLVSTNLVLSEEASKGFSKSFLFDNLAKASTQQQGREIEGEIWQFWFDQSPTKEVRKYLDKGMERRRAYDYEAAENALTKVIELAPDYAEGHNQRAFVRFLRENTSGALVDLEKALELEPKHFGALSGMYHVLRLMNRHDTAFETLRRAVIIHPWIKERGALPKDLVPERI